MASTPVLIGRLQLTSGTPAHVVITPVDRYYQVAFISVVVAAAAAGRTLRLYHLPPGSSRENSTTIFYKSYPATFYYTEQHFQGMILSAADVLDAEANAASAGEYITIYVYGIEIT